MQGERHNICACGRAQTNVSCVCLLGARLHHDDDQHRTRDPYSVLVCRCANEVAGQFELAINAMTAKALGISVSRALLLRADRVIE